MERRLFSVPPSLASRLLLSRAIKASKPSRTKEVFSLTPVSRDAFSNILSSMLSVVLICINVHYICIYVNRQNLCAIQNIPNNNRGLFRPIIDFEIWNATKFLFIILFLFWAFFDTVFKLAQSYWRDTDFRYPAFHEPFDYIRWFSSNDIDADVCIEHMLNHNGSRESWGGWSLVSI